MGSLITSHEIATTLRGFEEGSSFGPSLRKRSAASLSDNPRGCLIEAISAAETAEHLSLTMLVKDMADKDAGFMVIQRSVNRQSGRPGRCCRIAPPPSSDAA